MITSEHTYAVWSEQWCPKIQQQKNDEEEKEEGEEEEVEEEEEEVTKKLACDAKLVYKLKI